MTTRYITRLCAIEQDDGRTRIVLQSNIGNAVGRLLDVIGPSPVVPSEGLLTRDELAAWGAGLTGTGHTFHAHPDRDHSRPDVEALDGPDVNRGKK